MDQLVATVNKLSSNEQKLQQFYDIAPIEQLHNLKLYLDDLYYNTNASPVDDWDYDMLKETLVRRDPGYVPPVGAKIRSHENRVPLPVWMGSMDKLKPENEKEIARWIVDNPAPSFEIASKLDGVSCLAVYGDQKNKLKLYTRGDGEVGADISYLAQYLNIPAELPDPTIIRGELIIPKDVFERKHGDRYANPRNMVAGLIGAKTIRAGLQDLHFVAYEMVGDGTMPPMNLQYPQLEELGFEVAKHETMTELTIEALVEALIRFKNTEQYEIDGIIITSNVPYDRNRSGNPSYAFAFKMRMADSVVTATVTEVEWNETKWGKLYPRVYITPIRLSGVTISKATAFSAKFVEENRLGPGAQIRLTRSGDVIPFIVEVITPAAEPSFPDVPYEWDSNHVHIQTIESSEVMCIKIAANFFAQLGIKHVGEAYVRKLYEGGLTSLLSILRASEAELVDHGLGEGQARRAYRNIRSGLTGVSIPAVVAASGTLGYGLGKKKINLLFQEIPELLDTYQQISTRQLRERINQIEGFSDISTSKVLANIEWADRWVTALRPLATFQSLDRVSNELQGQKFVMTGFRDKAMEAEIAKRGGQVTGSVSRKTTALIVKSKSGAASGKRKKAEQLGRPVYTADEFRAQFLN